MTSFSQIIQDAPFGIQGVANNITQLTMQFGNLSTKTGGAGTAMKAMLKTLAGPAGILLVVSIVTSLMVSFGDSMFKSKTDAEKLAEKQEKLAKALEKYKKGLEAVDKAQLKGTRSAVKELTTLKLLNIQINDSTLSNEKRTDAIDELRKKYPSYLKGMSDEKILTEGLKSTYDQLTESILKKAKAQAAASLITEKEKKILELTSQLEAKSIKNAGIRLNTTRLDNKIKAQGALITQADAEASQRAQTKLNKGLKEENKLIKGISVLQQESLKLVQLVGESGGIVPLDFGKETGIVDPKKAIEQNLKTLNFYNKRAKEIQEKGFMERAIIQTNALQQSSTELLAGRTEQQRAEDMANQAQFEKYVEHTNRMNIAMQDFSNAANDIVHNGLIQTFNALGDAIGDSLANGGNALEAAGAVVLGSLGGILQQYGSLVIAAGFASEALSAMMKNPFSGGIGAIIAGTALVAIGGAIKGFAKNASNGGSGGSSSGVSDAGGSSRGLSSSTSGGGFSNSSGGTVVFEIAGTKLIGVLSNTLNRNKALGGNFVLAT